MGLKKQMSEQRNTYVSDNGKIKMQQNRVSVKCKSAEYIV